MRHATMHDPASVSVIAPAGEVVGRGAGGVDTFREPGTEVVAHARNPWQQADDLRVQPFRSRRAYFAWAAAIDGKRGSGAPPQSRPEPTILVHDRLALELGGLRVEVIACTGAETVDSLLVWLPASRVCITPTVCSKPSRYRTRLLRLAPAMNASASAAGSWVGNPS